MLRLPGSIALALFAVVLAGRSFAPDFGIVVGERPYKEGDKPKGWNGVAGCELYEVTIETGDVTNGGTDGTVYLTINGNGTTGPIDLSETEWQRPEGGDQAEHCTAKVVPDDANPANMFEAGSVEKFRIWAAPVGIEGITATIEMKSNGTAGAGWFLKSLLIDGSQKVAGKNLIYRYHHTAWFNNWIEAGQTYTVAPGGVATDTFTLTFQTGTDSGAGTDSDITVRLDGVDDTGVARSFERVVNPFLSGNAFENGQRDTAVIDGVPQMTRLTSVTITSADNYAGSAWQLNSLEISAPALCGGAAGSACTNGAVESFGVGKWLGGDDLSATVRPASRHEPLGAAGLDESQAQFCVRYARNMRVPDSAASVICPGSTDAIADVACVAFAMAFEQPADVWAQKCAAGTEAALKELEALVVPQDTAAEQPPSMALPENPDPIPAAASGSEEERCRGMLDGKVAWDQSGSTQWQAVNIEALCAGATDADARIACFQGRIAAGEPWNTALPACVADDGAAPQPEEPQPAAIAPPAEPAAEGGSEEERCRTMIDGQVAYDQQGSTSWNAGNIAALCAGATDAEARIACFENRIANGESWSTAIPACAADDGAGREQPQPAAVAPTGSSAEAERCKSLLQDQVPWQIDPTTERHWEQEDLDALCDGTTDSAGTVRCFQEALYNSGSGGDIDSAIDACRAN